MIRTQSITILHEPMPWYVHREHSFNNQSKIAYSHMLVCPKCETTWARLKFLEDDDSLVWPVSQFCKLCGVKDEWHPVPGSILVEEGWGTIDDSLLAALPPDLVAREFDLHMRAYANG